MKGNVNSLDLGLDISTSKIGISILSRSTVKEIIFQNTLFLDNKTALEERAMVFKNVINELQLKYQIVDIFIEEPLISSKNQNTVAILQRFNGMCCFVTYEVFQKLPEMINVRTARGLLGIKIPRETKATKDKKKIIIDYMEKYFQNSKTPFVYENTKFGNPKSGVDDIADSLVLCLAGSILQSRKKLLTTK